MKPARGGAAGLVPAALLVSTVSFAAAPVPTPPPTAPRPGAIVLVTIDGLRVDHVGSYTGGAHPTPGLDALAASGARFARAYVASPAMGPSTGTLLTGLLPAHHGWRRDYGGRVSTSVTTLAALLGKAGYATTAIVSTRMLNSEFGLQPGFDRYDDDLKGIRKQVIRLSPERRASEALDLALRAIDQAAGKSFFLWLNLHDPHYDYEPPPDLKTRFADDPYSGEVAAADAAVGALVDGLKQRGRDRILVVVVGSQGEGLGDHAEYGSGVYLHETTIRVPLLLAGSGIAPGTVVDRPTSLVDIAPTILDFAGVQAKAMDGQSLRAWLVPGQEKPGSRSAAKPAPIFVESVHAMKAYGWAPLYAVIDGTHKIVQGKRLEAFDLAADPGETQPLAKAPRWADDLVRYGAPLLEPLGPSPERRKEIADAVARVKTPWDKNSPFCLEKTDFPDPRDPEKRALAFPLQMALLEAERSTIGYAYDDARMILETDPSNLTALEVETRLGIRNKWGDMLIEPLEIMVCDYPFAAVGYHQLGHYYFQQQQWQAAAEAFNMMVVVEPENQEAHYDLACALAQQDKLDDALAHLKRSIDLGGDDYDIIRRDPKLFKLKDDPRFQALLPKP